MSKWKKSSQELIEAFYSALENEATLEMRKMFGYPCAFIKGNMCTGLHEENWIIRLSEEDLKEIKDTYYVEPFEPIKGRIMREYIAIPEKVKTDHLLLMQWLAKSIAFTSSLPTKTPKKKNKKLLSKTTT